jgi:TolC family type I secretion outer membrane protein
VTIRWRKLLTIQRLAVFSCALLISTQNALAADPFSTENLIRQGSFDQVAEEYHCDKQKILKPLSLTDVVDLALCNNPQTRLLWSNLRVQAAQLGVSNSAYLPTLNAVASVSQNQSAAGVQTQTDNTSATASLTLNYLLYDFGGRSGTLENAKQLLFAANATRDATLQGNYLAAVQAYYVLLSARASVEAFKVDEIKAQESLAAAQARYLAGVVTPVDRLQAQTNLSQAHLNRIRSEGDASNAQGALANIMGFDASQTYTLTPVSDTTPDPVIEQDIGKLIATARQKRPDLAAAESQILAAEAQLSATKATGRPTLNLGIVAGVTNPNLPNGTLFHTNSVGITLSVPIFSGFRTHYQVRAAAAQIEGRVADRDRVAHQIALDVWRAYQSLLTNSLALRSADELVQAASQSEKMILGRYKAGVGNILDTLNAQSALANAQQQRVAALYSFLISRFALAQAIGELDLTQLERLQ